MTTHNYSYGNRVLRAVNFEGRIWFLLEDVSAMAGTVYRGYHLQRAGLRPVADFRKFNVTALPDDVPNGHIMRGERILISEGGFFQLIFGGRSEFARDFQNWVKDELWPALIHDGFYAAPEGSVIQEVLDRVVMLEAEVVVLNAMREFGGDATLGDLAGWQG